MKASVAWVMESRVCHLGGLSSLPRAIIRRMWLELESTLHLPIDLNVFYKMMCLQRPNFAWRDFYSERKNGWWKRKNKDEKWAESTVSWTKNVENHRTKREQRSLSLNDHVQEKTKDESTEWLMCTRFPITYPHYPRSTNFPQKIFQRVRGFLENHSYESQSPQLKRFHVERRQILS